MGQGKKNPSAISFKINAGIIEERYGKLLQQLEKLEFPAQAIDARFVAGKKHLLTATKLAARSIKKGKKERIAEDPALEVVLFAAATRQIDKAIKRIGLRKDTEKIAFISSEPISEGMIKFKEKMEVLDFSEEKIKHLIEAFELTEKEVKTVGKEKIPLLIQEKVVLSGMER